MIIKPLTNKKLNATDIKSYRGRMAELSKTLRAARHYTGDYIKNSIMPKVLILGEVDGMALFMPTTNRGFTYKKQTVIKAGDLNL